ncbi:origin recognition complex subunit 4 [Phymastichus coffea]|uniref:origin recognition complex subunit 4 n=1 Tax=Phymastichus coffea TaxID=108790 RepID=UPI00273C1F19|nr:origin recognition complex subunit 4 [Phymastichus coffea]
MSKKDNTLYYFHDNQILLTRKYLKNKIICDKTKYEHYIQERLQILDLIKCTIDMGESNSILLIGPRGCGKTALINSVLKEVLDIKNFEENIIVVKLHGLVHTDDRLALKDVIRQMQLENVFSDIDFGTFAENLSFLIESLKSGNRKCSKPIIFILDEFDLFCVHHNQTLLYNLFDVAQSDRAPICVIGITCRLDVIELLEKRVKSRFSHRQIFLYPGNISSLKSSAFENRLELFQDLLSLPLDENISKISQTNKIDNMGSKFQTQWNKQIDNLRNNINIVNLLKQMHCSDRSEKKFRNFLAIVVSILVTVQQVFHVDDFIYASKIFSRNEKVLILQGLSILEMCLVIAMKHETEIYNNGLMNFEKIWSRYLKFGSRNSSIESVQRPVVIKAFEHIKALELIVSVGLNQRNEKEYQSYKFTLTSQQVMEAVKNYNGLPTDVTQWADSSIL